MIRFTQLAQALSIISFAWYGVSCFFYAPIITDFARYGPARLRVLTGTLQVAGSLGLLLGYRYRPLLMLSAGGLAAMMSVAILLRLKLRDPLRASVPAFFYLCLNLFLVGSRTWFSGRGGVWSG